MKGSSIAIGLAAGLLRAVSVNGQDDSGSTTTVHAAVIFTRHGDRTPLNLPGRAKLTQLGASQLFNSGSLFRGRYIETSDAQGNDSAEAANGPISGIAPFVIDNSQINTLTVEDEYVVASAQAFLQGLYPPLNESNSLGFPNDDPRLGNGSSVYGPLGGYQYPQLQVPSVLDPYNIWVDGATNCPNYNFAGARYFSSDEFRRLQNETQDFYSGFQTNGILQDSFPQENIGFVDAFSIFDFVNYTYTHNETAQKTISNGSLARLQDLAYAHEYALNGDFNTDPIRTIAGSTLASQVLGLLSASIASEGASAKMSLLFGGHEAFLAFFSLAQLTDRRETFTGLPGFGSSMVFELFSISNSGSNSSDFPSEDDLRVRFLFRNGTEGGSSGSGNSTGNEDDLTAYPLFARPINQLDMSWTEFKTGMTAIMTPTTGDWCDSCGSIAPFCAYYGTDDSVWINVQGGDGSGTGGGRRRSSGMSAQVAGVIGAAVTLAVLILAVAVAMLLFGVRFYRNSSRRKSDLGGFKGGEKLASDADLTSGIVAPGSAPDHPRGHERVGSWELREGRRAEDSAFGSLARPESAHHRDDLNPFGEPVKTRESI
ncbi:MAG: hypothetical protein M1825_000190 [Sarcosagium campestre]|nr:MAG: hypothetical protein M1825_000190 [Sarcosagium campestre]